MEGDKNKEDPKRKEKEKLKKKQSKSPEDGEVKILSMERQSGDSKDQIHVELERAKTDHRLNLVNYNFRNKYKPCHNREYGVNYNRDIMAYNYRGYDIKEPKVNICPALDVELKYERWVQYMSHVERQPAMLPRMFYHPNDNSFVLIVLMSLLFLLLMTCGMCAVAKVVKAIHTFIEVYYFMWLPGTLGVVFTLVMVNCVPCSRKFPWSLIMLIINVVSMIWMCMFVTAYHDSFLPVFALIPICIIVLIMIIFALCGIDMRRKKFMFFIIVLTFIVVYVELELFERFLLSWMTPLFRRENLMVMGVMLYIMSMNFMLIQLIEQGGYLLLSDEDYAVGTFLLYMCIPSLFFKIMSYMGLFQEQKCLC